MVLFGNFLRMLCLVTNILVLIRGYSRTAKKLDFVRNDVWEFSLPTLSVGELPCLESPLDVEWLSLRHVFGGNLG